MQYSVIIFSYYVSVWVIVESLKCWKNKSRSISLLFVLTCIYKPNRIRSLFYRTEGTGNSEGGELLVSNQLHWNKIIPAESSQATKSRRSFFRT